MKEIKKAEAEAEVRPRDLKDGLPSEQDEKGLHGFGGGCSGGAGDCADCVSCAGGSGDYGWRPGPGIGEIIKEKINEIKEKIIPKPKEPKPKLKS